MDEQQGCDALARPIIAAGFAGKASKWWIHSVTFKLDDKATNAPTLYHFLGATVRLSKIYRMAGPSSGPSWAQQTSLIDELLESIQQYPSSIDAHKLLAEQYQSLGWDDAAADVARNILLLDQNDLDAKAILVACAPIDPPIDSVTHVHPPPPLPTASSHFSVQQLSGAYQSLRDEAKNLLQEMIIFQELASNADCAEQIADLTALSEGRMFSVAKRNFGAPSASKLGPPRTARALAASMKSNLKNALNVVYADFEALVRWKCGSGAQMRDGDDDSYS